MSDVLEFDKNDLRKLVRLSKRFPKETYRAIGRAGASLRGKLRKVMRSSGGVEGVPKFAMRNIDTMLIGALKANFSEKIGGKLAENSSIQMFNKRKGGFSVGFISGLEPYARMLQTSEARPLTVGEKIFFNRAGVDSTVYIRPARPIIDPFSVVAKRDLIKLAIHNTEKILEKGK